MSRRWVIAVLAGSLVLAAGLSGAAHAAWPGYNGRIAFEGGSGQIDTVNPDGSGLSEVFGPYSGSLGHPNGIAWAQNGWVAYDAPVGDGHEDTNITVFPTAGIPHQVELWGEDDLGSAFDAAWSPDGLELVFICKRDPNTPSSTVPTGICEVGRDGGSVTLLVPGSFIGLAWSPDGSRIAYSTASDLYVAHADGSGPVVISHQPLTDLDWSPDGLSIAGGDGSGGVTKVTVSSGNTAQIATHGGSPSWSPDGKQLVYVGSLGTGPDLVIARADGSSPRLLSDPNGTPYWAFDPTWLPGSPPPTLSPPTVTGRPTIAGVAKQGELLTASPGAWNGDPPLAFSYQWQRCDGNGVNCDAIQTATNQTYTVVTTDVGDRLRVVVTASNKTGKAASGSDATGLVAAAHVAPTIRAAYARWSAHAIRLTVTVCGEGNALTTYATDSIVIHKRTTAKRTRSWATTNCHPTVDSWTAQRSKGTSHVIAVRARDANGLWSRPVRLTLR